MVRDYTAMWNQHSRNSGVRVYAHAEQFRVTWTFFYKGNTLEEKQLSTLEYDSPVFNIGFLADLSDWARENIRLSED